MCSGCGNLIAVLPFVCHSTPHFDSTSREVPTLFPLIIHENGRNVNPQLAENIQLWKIQPKTGSAVLGKANGKEKVFVQNDEKVKKNDVNTLAICALLLYNNANLL